MFLVHIRQKQKQNLNLALHGLRMVGEVVVGVQVGLQEEVPSRPALL